MKIEKIKPRTAKRGKLRVDPETEVEVEHDDYRTTIIYNNQVVSWCEGDWLEYCFIVKDYKVCISREDLEDIVG